MSSEKAPSSKNPGSGAIPTSGNSASGSRKESGGVKGEAAETKAPEAAETIESRPSSALPGSSAVSSPLGAPGQASYNFPHIPTTPGAQNGSGVGSSVNQSSLSVAEGPSVINKQLLSKLNKSMKEKQRIVNSKTDARNPALIQSIVTSTPSHATLPNVGSEKGEKTEKMDEKPAESSAPDVKDPQENEPQLHSLRSHSRTETPLSTLPPVASGSMKPEHDGSSKSRKKISKQNSSRTDFFAAKLASAVDDVSSSDSDETFVYETSTNEFENPANNASTQPSSGVSGPATLHQADSTLESANPSLAPMNLGLDQIGGVASNGAPTPLDSVVHSPAMELKRELGDDTNGPNEPAVVQHAVGLLHRPESIHSVQSSKWNLKNTVGTSSNVTPPTTTALRGQPQTQHQSAQYQQPHVMSMYGSNSGSGSGSETHSYANPYIENNKTASLRAHRKSSSHSLLNSDPHKGLTANTSPRYASSHNFGSALDSPVANSINEESHDGRYSFDDDNIIGDEVSYHGDVASVCTDLNNPIPQPGESNAKHDDHLAVNSRSSERNQKSSTTSSKLRSTTSKLFDKNGAQPRRYSIIPDDIDIEDFDDDLIYYDNNNIRFPYNSQNGSHLNETTSLLNSSHPRMTHYRSLNLGNPGSRSRQQYNSKRYASLGFPSPQPQGTGRGNNVVPFPFNDQNYYFDPENYDEEANMDSPDEVIAKSLFAKRGKLSPSNPNFLLPRKVSITSDRGSGGRVKCLKSFVYTMVSIILILAIGFVSGFLLASTKDLADLSIVSIDDALVSQDELLFSVVVEALNPGWFTISIDELELDIFAKSGYVKDTRFGMAQDSAVETVLLGSVSSFETAVDFEGSFLQRAYQQQSGEIKLIAPGHNLTGSIENAILQKSLAGGLEESEIPDNSEKWQKIRKHPFDLILRGVMMYKLPLSSTQKSVVVNKVGYIDPDRSEGVVMRFVDAPADESPQKPQEIPSK